MRVPSPKVLGLVTCALFTTLLLVFWDQQRRGDRIPLRPSPLRRRLVTPATRSYIGQVLTNNTVNGFALAIVRPGGNDPVEYGSWGNQNEDGDLVSPDTLFTVGSVTKAFTATSIGILIDDFALGRNVTALPAGAWDFSWKTKAKDLLGDDWGMMDGWADEKTSVGDILTHLSGLPNHDYSYGPDDLPLNTLRHLRHLRPAYELRETWHYNNVMYVVASHIVTIYSGMPFGDFVQSRIFEPLKMTSSTLYPDVALRSGKFSASWNKHGRLIPRWLVGGDRSEVIAGAGGVISSATDITRWMNALLCAHHGKDVEGVPARALTEPMEGHSLNKPLASAFGLSAYGYGWWITSYHGHPVTMHYGGLPGMSTLLMLLPADNIGIMLFANADSKSDANMDIALHLVNSALGISGDGFPVVTAPLIKQLPAPSAFLKGAPALTRSSGQDELPLDAYSGTYSDPGYGTFTLCTSRDTSSYCTGVVSDFSMVDAASLVAPSSEAQVLFARWPRLWSSHLRLTRRTSVPDASPATDVNEFAFKLSTLFIQGYGHDKTPFETGGLGPHEFVARFVVEQEKVIGFGLFGTVGGVTDAQKWGKIIKEQADVWFERV